MNTQKFKSEIAGAGFTQRSLAFAIGMPEETLCRKIRTGKFSIDEAALIADVTNMQDPIGVFFTKRKKH